MKLLKVNLEQQNLKLYSLIFLGAVLSFSGGWVLAWQLDQHKMLPGVTYTAQQQADQQDSKDQSDSDKSDDTADNVPKKPNIIYVLADDLDTKAMKYMSKLKSLITDQGTTLSNNFYNISQCCPSRSTILRGQYYQNTGVYDNGGPNGGYSAFVSHGDEKSTTGVWLQQAGYQTGFIGKYLNGYLHAGEPDDDKSGGQIEAGTNEDDTDLPDTHVPPGWDDWYGFGGGYGGYDYQLNDNGKVVTKGKASSDYATDVMAAEAQRFVKTNLSAHKPFYLQVATFAPHSPSTPAEKYKDAFLNVTYPQNDNFNEDVSDKTSKLKNAPELKAKDIEQINERFRKRIQSLQSVDDMIAGLVSTLQNAGQLNSTYLVFGSDNGFHQGEHRLENGKLTAFEEDIRVPLIVRGPGIAKNKTLSQMVGNVDMAPTFADMANAKIPDFVDGRSFLPLLLGQTPAWRNAYPIYSTGKGNYVEAFTGVRTAQYTYAEYQSGARELYDLKKDPFELNNIYGSASPALISKLHTITHNLATCKASSCRNADRVSF